METPRLTVAFQSFANYYYPMSSVYSRAVVEMQYISGIESNFPAFAMYVTWKIVISIYIVLLIFADHIGGGGYPQAVYDQVRALFQGNDALILILGTWFVGLGAYVISNIPFVLLDLFHPEWVQKYRVQDPDAGIKVTAAELLSAMKVNSINILIVNPLAASGMYLLHQMMGGKGLGGYLTFDTSPELPSLRTALLQLPVMLAGAEIGFYYSHKWLHDPSIYKYIHKVHHTWNRPSSIMSVYAHPIEYFLGNILPIFWGSVFMGSHIFVAWCFSVFITWHTTSVHSGYHLPLITPSPEFHDHHHRVFGECFGTFGFLDKYHGTCSTFLKSVQYQRHYTILSIKSARELHPDAKKSK